MKQYALLIIDMQNDFVQEGSPFYIPQAQATIPSIRRVLNFFRDLKWPIFHIIRNYRSNGSDVEITRLNSFFKGEKIAIPGTHGSSIVKELTPLQDEFIIIKQRFSAFMATELDFILRRLKIEDLVVCGTQLPACVRETIFDAIAFDYSPLLLTDSCSAKNNEIVKNNIKDIQDIGVKCITTDEFIKSNSE